MLRPTHAIIDLNCIAYNVRSLRARTSPDAQFMAVVKANAYGHGSVDVSKVALREGASFLGVAILEEALELRAAGIDAPMLVFGATTGDDYFDTAIEKRVSLTVFDSDDINAIARRARAIGKKALLHVKVDSGMHRLGIQTRQAAIELLDCADKNRDAIDLEGIFTHFADADNADKEYTNLQAKRFDEIVEHAKARGYTPIVHAANSAAIHDLPQYHFDMVRAGISLYGYYPSNDVSHDAPLRPAMKWVTQIAQLNKIAQGETIGYGRTFEAQKDMIVATLPVGYGDGYKRVFSNSARVLVKGQRAPIIGRVCMDQCMADVTDIVGVQRGDEVVLLGSQVLDCVDADELAGVAKTISYEILLSVSERVPRVYIENRLI